MSDSDLDDMLKKARALRDEKVAQRSILDHEIAGLEKAIEGLTTLCELPPDEPPAVTSFAQEMLKYAGLTDVVRMCLQASPMPISAGEIVAKLKDTSYPIGKLDNPRAAVNTILSRLLGAGEIQRRERGGDVLYSWISATPNFGALARALIAQAPMSPRTRQFGPKRGEGQRASSGPGRFFKEGEKK
jgi:hypothetical protein